jgi:predicted GTPase
MCCITATVTCAACSDISYASIQQLAARVRAAGANFMLLGARQGMLASSKPVVAVTAVRTGCGKSQVCVKHGHACAPAHVHAHAYAHVPALN